jgi:hypothetical protein
MSKGIFLAGNIYIKFRILLLSRYFSNYKLNRTLTLFLFFTTTSNFLIVFVILCGSMLLAQQVYRK